MKDEDFLKDIALSEHEIVRVIQLNEKNEVYIITQDTFHNKFYLYHKNKKIKEAESPSEFNKIIEK